MSDRNFTEHSRVLGNSQTISSIKNLVAYPIDKLSIMINESRDMLLLNLYTIETTIHKLIGHLRMLKSANKRKEDFYSGFEFQIIYLEEKYHKRKQKLLDNLSELTQETIEKKVNDIFENLPEYTSIWKEVRKYANELWKKRKGTNQPERMKDDWFDAIEEVKQRKLENTLIYLTSNNLIPQPVS